MASMRELLKALVGVNIEIDGVTYPNSYADDLSIDRSDLDAEFVEHAERYAYYATLAELADDRATRLKEDMEHLFAAIDVEKRRNYDQLKLQDPKLKMTEAMFEHEVRLDQRYQTKLAEYQTARHLAKVLKAAPIAFAHRRDMLTSIGERELRVMSSPQITQGRQQVARNLIQRKQAPQLPPAEEAPPAELLDRPAEESQSEPAPARRRAPRSA